MVGILRFQWILANHYRSFTIGYMSFGASQEMFEKTYGVTEPHPNCLDNLNENLALFGLE
jgi:hypothetical protein